MQNLNETISTASATDSLNKTEHKIILYKRRWLGLCYYCCVYVHSSMVCAVYVLHLCLNCWSL